MKLDKDKCFDSELFQDDACSDMSGSTFYRCKFVSVNMVEAVARNCSFENCLFIGCDISRLSVSSSSFQEVQFVDCRILGVDWSKVSPLVFSVDIKDSNASYSSFDGLALRGCVFQGVNLTDCSFSMCDLTSVDFDACEMSGVSFSRSILKSTDFSSSSNVVLDHRECILRDTKINVTDALSILQRQGIVV
jgi:fluoroquinolone resistance protein